MKALLPVLRDRRTIRGTACALAGRIRPSQRDATESQKGDIMLHKISCVAVGLALGIGGAQATSAAQTVRALPAISAEFIRGASTIGARITRVRNRRARGHVLSGVLRGHFRGHGGTRLRFHGLGDNRSLLRFHPGRLVFHRAYIQHRFTHGGGAYDHVRRYYPPGHWGYHGAYYQGYPDTGGHAVYVPGQRHDARHDNLYIKYHDK